MYKNFVVTDQSRHIYTLYRCSPLAVDFDDVDLRSDFFLWTLRRLEQNIAVIYLRVLVLFLSTLNNLKYFKRLS